MKKEDSITTSVTKTRTYLNHDQNFCPDPDPVEVGRRYGYSVLISGFQAIIMSFLININILVFCGDCKDVLLFLTLGGCQMVTYYLSLNI